MTGATYRGLTGGVRIAREDAAATVARRPRARPRMSHPRSRTLNAADSSPLFSLCNIRRGRAAARVDGIAAPVLARPVGSDFDGAVDAIQFALDNLPTIGYTGSVWQGAENRWERGPLGRLVLRPEIGRTLVNCPAAAGRLYPRECTTKQEPSKQVS